MTSLFADAFADAAALFQRERDLLMRVAAVFFFLPAFALELFLPDVPATGALTSVEAMEAQIGYLRANGGWLMTASIVSLLGEAALLVLLLDPRRPPLSSAIATAFGLLIAFFLAELLQRVVVSGGVLLLILPGLYLTGRLFLVAPVVATEGVRNPLRAVARSFELTEGRGWLLFGVAATVFAPGWLLSSMAHGVERSLAAGGGINPTAAIVAAIAAFAAAGVALATLLLQVCVYRRLTGASSGT